jgi:hypothetical protein
MQTQNECHQVAAEPWLWDGKAVGRISRQGSGIQKKGGQEQCLSWEPENMSGRNERGTFPDGPILFLNMVPNRNTLPHLHTGFSFYEMYLLLKSFIKPAFPFTEGNSKKSKVKRSRIAYYSHQQN